MSIDPDLSAFVRQYVPSVWALELLLLLKRDPEICWEAGDLVRELRASTKLVAENLAVFHTSGLVVEDDASCHRYAPASHAFADLCDQLERAYRERPVAIVNLIARPRNALQSLADAFKLKGDING